MQDEPSSRNVLITIGLGAAFIAGIFVNSITGGGSSNAAPAPYTPATPTCRVESSSLSRPVDGGTGWNNTTLYYGACRIAGDE